MIYNIFFTKIKVNLSYTTINFQNYKLFHTKDRIQNNFVNFFFQKRKMISHLRLIRISNLSPKLKTQVNQPMCNIVLFKC